MRTVLFLFCVVFCMQAIDCCDRVDCSQECKSTGLFHVDQQTCECVCEIMVDDIRMTVREWEIITGKTNDGRAASIFAGRWDTPTSDGFFKVPYYYSKDIQASPAHRDAISRAVGVFNAFSCLKFVPAQVGDSDMIEFIKDRNRCYSYIGKTGGKQVLSIGEGCQYTGVVEHELLHALGFWHEQSRPDRDNYVRILEQNIIAGLERNFYKRPVSQVDSFSSPYDFMSVMHYSSAAFSKNDLPTIVKRSDNSTFSAQRWGMSFEDKVQLLAMYNCNGKRGIPETTACYHSLDRGHSYRGNVSVTRSGRTCQRWDTHTPHAHNLDPSIVTGGDLVENYCRNPNVDNQGPWCFTTDPNVPFEPCDIPICEDAVPKVGDALGPFSNPGFWSNFTEWSQCLATCGQGFQYRTRHCIGNEPGSENCPGEFWESSPCPPMDPCPGSWNNWEEYSECSKGCGKGKRMRIRTCSTDSCARGTPFQKRTCKNKDCPLYDDGDCFDRTNLDSYRGTMSQTQRGRKCRKWKQTPIKPSAYPDKDLNNKYCRNPTNQSLPFCYINKRKTQPCKVSLCNEDAVWGNYSEWSGCHCKTGKRYATRKCVGGIKGQGLCVGSPWKIESCSCGITPNVTAPPPVTMAPPTPYPPNHEMNCVNFSNAPSYRGNSSTTSSGHTCQRWDSQFPHNHEYRTLEQIVDAGLDENYCRTPDDGDIWPWCYVESYITVKEFCDIPECISDPPPPAPPIGCVDGTLESAMTYRGGLSMTVGNRTCQRWDLNIPHHHTTKSHTYPDAGLGPHNYCRSLGYHSVWCYTTDPDQQWEDCAVPAC
uniref:Metalloendopeptidase n=1 Tax=Phallusia mammillata TaxID=59560 RepID=A0A6F9DJ25_9ASCI|nr:apolipoprotein(a)-like [Phallusia mammillata]